MLPLFAQPRHNCDEYNEKWEAGLLTEIYLIELMRSLVHFGTNVHPESMRVVFLYLVTPPGEGMAKCFGLVEGETY